MKFIIERTSDMYGEDLENPPCEKAFKGTYTPVEYHAVSHPHELIGYRHRNSCAAESMAEWKSEGSNHRINDKGWIERDGEPKECWFVEIETLEELIELRGEVGEDLIITHKFEVPKEDYRVLEIYDDYRE